MNTPLDRTRPRGRRLTATLAVILLATVLTACGSGDEDAGGGGGGDLGGNTLVVGMTATDLPLLDTGLSQNEGYEGVRFVGNQLYDGLTRFDLSSEDEIPQIVPALAESWEANEDLTIWTFKLRSGVTFHDGEPWDADAAIYNLERYVDESSPQFYQELNAQAGLNIQGIESVRKVDDMTIEITTPEPWSYLPADLATVFYGSPAAIEELGNDGFADAPVGTGPFEFAEKERGSRLVLKRFDDYWRGAPKLDTLVLRPIPDPTARVAALRSGEVNWIEVPLPDDVPVLESDGFEVLLNSYDHIWPWVFDTTKEPFDDPKVRQALNYAINRDSLSDNILSGTGVAASQIVPEANFAYRAENDRYEYDPDRAKALLAEAGYPDGFSFTLSFPTSGSGNMVPVPMNEALQADLAAVGVDVELAPIEWAAMLTDFFEGKIPDGAEAINISLSFQQEGFWSTWLGAESTLNVGGYDNPEVEALFGEARTVLEEGDRGDIYAAAAALVNEDAPWLFVVSDLNPRAISSDVNGFVMPKSWFVDLTTVSVG